MSNHFYNFFDSVNQLLKEGYNPAGPSDFGLEVQSLLPHFDWKRFHELDEVYETYYTVLKSTTKENGNTLFLQVGFGEGHYHAEIGIILDDTGKIDEYFKDIFEGIGNSLKEALINLKQCVEDFNRITQQEL